jgi:signal transduction histidine kinase
MRADAVPSRPGALRGVRSLYLRIYLTVVLVLLVFALLAGVLVRRHTAAERVRIEAAIQERGLAWAGLLEQALPPATAPVAEQRDALEDNARRLRLPLALDDAQGQRIATSSAYTRLRERAADASSGDRPERGGVEGGQASQPATRPAPADAADRAAPDLDRRIALRVALSDGRVLWLGRPHRRGPPPWSAGLGNAGHGRGEAFDGPPGAGRGRLGWWGAPPWLDEAGALALLLALVFVAVAAGSYPVVRRLTRRLEALQRGVETFGAGDLTHRVPITGRDEVAALAQSFNRAAQQVEDLVHANRSLLANASHEIRSPLARLKMAVEMLESAPPERRAALKAEVDRDIRELDALVEEVLLASRLDARADLTRDSVDLLGLLAEEAARVDAGLQVLAPEPTGADSGGESGDVSGARLGGGPGVETGGEMTTDAASGLGDALLLQGDERLLRRALRNLLENARRYGGDEVEVHCQPFADRIEVRICDRGPGVPPALAERVFEPFFRLPGHAEMAGGVGLGLSLVRQIAQRHGGEVRCEARPGGGSCFVLSLPRA